MATTEIPPEPPHYSPVPELTGRRRATEPVEYVPILLNQLQDDLSRSRLREAFWISVVLHMLVIIFLGVSPKLFPVHPVQVATAEDLINGKDLTFLQLPADAQKLAERPRDPKFASDKDRIAEHRTPQIDKKTLEELRSAQRPGPPQAPGQPSPRQMAENSPPAMSGSGGGQPAPAPVQPRSDSNSSFSAPAQPRPNPFNVPMSAGASINEAARATTPGGGAGGAGGEFGLGPNGGSGRLGNIDVLSDTMGVDFGPYLSRVLQSVKMNWYTLIPEVARPPLLKRGKVSIEFVIMKDGKVAGMRIIGPSGDISLDRAAWGGISASNPFSPLPGEFRGPYLALRFHFYYNPNRNDLQ